MHTCKSKYWSDSSLGDDYVDFLVAFIWSHFVTLRSVRTIHSLCGAPEVPRHFGKRGTRYERCSGSERMPFPSSFYPRRQWMTKRGWGERDRERFKRNKICDLSLEEVICAETRQPGCQTVPISIALHSLTLYRQLSTSFPSLTDPSFFFDGIGSTRSIPPLGIFGLISISKIRPLANTCMNKPRSTLSFTSVSASSF